jgi:hypothetical protein
VVVSSEISIISATCDWYDRRWKASRVPAFALRALRTGKQHGILQLDSLKAKHCRMTSKPRTLDEARAAKTEATNRFGALASVVGVGITRIGDGFGLKINVSEQPKVLLPTEVGGVPVQVEVVGPIRKR